MSTTDTISPELTDSVLACLGERFQHGPIKMVQMEAKAEKVEPKVLVLSSYRAFILSCKVPTKLEHEFHYLEIFQLESLKPLQLKVHVSVKKESLPKTIFNLSASTTEEIDTIIEIIALDIKKCFPHVFPIENVIPRIAVKPENRLTSLNMKLEETYPDPGPCGGFTQMYACMCDLHQELYMPEVAWDVDTIYLSQDSKELCLNDFDHLTNRDLVPIISALIHNNWFTKLSFRNASKLNADATREINKVLQKSSYLEQLILENVGLKWSFTQDMCSAVMANRNTALRHINLSNNSLEDRGIRHLSSLLTKLPNGLVELNLAKTGLTAEGTLHFGKALVQNNFMSTSLVKLDVSGNAFKDGDISSLTAFLAQPNSLTHINMADTECALDNVFVALFRGCCSSLSHLNLAGNTFTYRKGKDVPIQVSFKQFFATSTKLKYLNLSRNKLPPEVVKEVLLGIGSNNNLENVELDLSCNELKTEGSQMIAGSIAHVNNIAMLNLSDNDINVELTHLITWLSHSKTIQSLDISKNMGGLKYKQLLKVLDAIVQLIQTEETALHTLSLADNKMKFETIQIINALGSNTSLTSIDISGNGMGDIGARMLAKAIQLNTKLHTVKLDGNCISATGFGDLANALEKNYTLKYMPTPVNDISTALKAHPEKTSAALQKIQNLLQRNHSQHKFHDEQAFRLQQGFLYTTSHQMVDKLVVQIQDTIKRLIDSTDDDVQADINKAQDYILDADNSKVLLAALHQVALNVESSELKTKLANMADQLRSIVETQLKGSASGMIEKATNQCSTVMLDSALKESLDNMCQEQTKLPARFLQDVVEQVGAAISNRMGEAHLAMASHVSDTIIDEIMEQLTESYQKLSEQQALYQERKGSVLTNGTEVAVNDKDAEGEKEDRELMAEEESKSPDAASAATRQLASQRLSRYQKREVGRGDSVRFKDSDASQQRKSGKVRPRSIIMKDFELTLTEVESTDSGDKLENDITDGATISKAPSISSSKPKSPTAKTSKKAAKQAAADTKALDEVAQSTETLTDVRKNRVRPPRQRPTRPPNLAQKSPVGQGNDSGAPAVDVGVDDFFSAGFTDLVPAKTTTTSTLKHTENDASPDLKTKKKRGLFHKKDKKEEEKPKKEEKKEEAHKGKKFGGLKGMFKRKQSFPSVDEPEQPPKTETKQGSPSLKVKSPEQPTVTPEDNKMPKEEEPPKVTEKKALQLPKIQRSFKTAASPPKEPEPVDEPPTPELKEEDDKDKAAESKEEVKAADDEAGNEEEEEEAAKEDGDAASGDQKEDAPQHEEAEEAPPEETKEEEKKPVPEMRKSGLAGAQMLGGMNMLQEMKRKQEKKAADRASREILESQSPKVGEDHAKEANDTDAATPSSPEKSVPNLDLQIPKATTPAPTSPSSGAKSPTAPPKISPSTPKPTLSPRVKSPLDSPRKSPLAKTPSKDALTESNQSSVQRQTSKEDATQNAEQLKENAKPKVEKDKPVIKPRPLSGKMDPPPKTSPTPPTTPEMSWSSDTGVKPSDVLKRRSVELKAKTEDRPASPEKKPSGNEPTRPPSRPGSQSEDKMLDPAVGKPNGPTLSPKPKPRPAKRPVSIAPNVAKKPEASELRKASAPAVHVTLSPSKSDDKPVKPVQEGTPQKSSSVNKDHGSKMAPIVATKPRSRSLDPALPSKVERKPSSEIKGESLLEVPSQEGKRDSIISKSSDEGAIEDPDEYSAL